MTSCTSRENSLATSIFLDSALGHSDSKTIAARGKKREEAGRQEEEKIKKCLLKLKGRTRLGI